MHAALAAFRAERGFGRAIAAPQLGVEVRMIAADLGQGPLSLINPEIVARGAATFTLWDDCLCFPDLLVRVRRACTIDLRFVDPAGQVHLWRGLDRARAELFQHEVDHLDGVLAVDRAEGDPSTVSRADFVRDAARFAAMVDGL